MANIEVKLESNTSAVDQALNEAIQRGLNACGKEAEGYAKMLCPVASGTLHNSITHTTDTQAQEEYIGTTVEYAPYVEFGTVKAKAQPFLRPAAEDHTDKYKAIFEQFLGEIK